MQHHRAIEPVLRNLDRAVVQPGGIALRRRWSIEPWPRHDDVRVVRPVANPLAGPTARDVHRVPRASQLRRFRRPCRWQQIRAVEQAEIPRAVERNPPGGLCASPCVVGIVVPYQWCSGPKPVDLNQAWRQDARDVYRQRVQGHQAIKSDNSELNVWLGRIAATASSSFGA